MKPAVKAFIDRFNPETVAPGAFAEADDIILFVHLPKTAGVSVGRGLRKVFDVYHPVDWNNVHASFVASGEAALTRRARGPSRQVIMGHFGFPQIRHWRNEGHAVRAASIIREPVARFVSNYNYNRSEKHPNRDVFSRRFPTIADYAEHVPADYQIKRLVGAFRSFEGALKALTRDYRFLGVAERLSASLEHLSRSHGLPPVPEHRANTAARKTTTDDLDEETRALILSKTENDRRLFELLGSLYGL